MSLPIDFIARVGQQLGSEAELFLAALATPSPTSLRLNPLKNGGDFLPIDFLAAAEKMETVAWAGQGLYLPQRPLFTADPLLHAGAYYVQEASSMFLEQIWRAAIDIAKAERGENTPLAVLDLCAAPGGKSTHAASILPENTLLVCNEIIANRAQILQENLQKWGASHAVVTQNNPQQLAERLPQFFDIILVDAPCSGEGMFRKDPAAAAHWSVESVEKCALRQREIIAAAWAMLRPNGVLIYSTCTYNKAENEENLAWWLSENEGECLSIPAEVAQKNNIEIIDYQTLDAQNVIGYRFWPHKIKGEGFFAAFMQKLDDDGSSTRCTGREKSFSWQGRKETEHLQHIFSEPKQWRWVLHRDEWRAFPDIWSDVYRYMYAHLRVAYAGITVAEQLRGELKPSPTLALHSHYAATAFADFEVDLATAQSFLRLDNFELPANAPRGWLRLCYKGRGLGWVKNMGERLNNYYPKQWKIRMELPM